MYVAEAAHYDRIHSYPVFVILLHMRRNIANVVVKAFTQDKWTHVAISFNKNLDPYYSFGRKNITEIGNGFVVSSPKNEFHRVYPTEYEVYVMYVTKEEYYKMIKRVDYFVQNKDKLKYDYTGLLYNLAQVPAEDREKWFCSRFVMDIIKSGGVPIPKDNNASLFDPQDALLLNNISYVNGGHDFAQYQSSLTTKNMKMLEKHRAPKLTDNTWFISDIHVFRGNGDEDEITRTINSKITNPEDTLFIMGDVGYKKDPLLKEHTKLFMSRINCKNVYLIAGNHDLLSKEDYYDCGFAGVYREFRTPKFIGTHAPVPLRPNSKIINIHGHIHGSKEYWECDPKNHVDCYWQLHGGPIQLKDLVAKTLNPDDYTARSIKLKNTLKPRKDLPVLVMK